MGEGGFGGLGWDGALLFVVERGEGGAIVSVGSGVVWWGCSKGQWTSEGGMGRKGLGAGRGGGLALCGGGETRGGRSTVSMWR